MTDLEIRIADASDAKVLAGLIAAFRDHLRAAAPTDAEIQRDLPAALRELALEFACAWLHGEAVGYTQLVLFPSIWAGGVEARLEDLFVLPTRDAAPRAGGSFATPSSARGLAGRGGSAWARTSATRRRSRCTAPKASHPRRTRSIRMAGRSSGGGTWSPDDELIVSLGGIRHASGL